MTEYKSVAELSVDLELYKFIEEEVLPGLAITTDQVWEGLLFLLRKFAKENQLLLEKRETFQKLIDEWYMANPDEPIGSVKHEQFLREIGYIVEEPKSFNINTKHIDPEISHTAGPQLVVPASNARFAVNAANARWGSLYDALYGTNAILASTEKTALNGYDPKRGAQVIAWAKAFLDRHFPLESGNYEFVTGFSISDEQLLAVIDGEKIGLKSTSQFVAYKGTLNAPESILLKNNGLHIELLIDPSGPIGGSDVAGINDVVIESAITTIVDCEDSVAAVDGADKTNVYRNWLGLMKGNIEAKFEKGGKSRTRSLALDKHYKSFDGRKFTLSGRSLMLVRNVGLLMKTPAVLWKDQQGIPEGILDTLITSLIALHDIKRGINSSAGSIYIVKPKMHGPEEVEFTNRVFDVVEDVLGLERYTLKIGVMDEERRTSVNLLACIKAVENRIIFINTGFLDRTGDELHTAKQAGIAFDKSSIKSADWLKAYEDNNVNMGLACGFRGRAQIGKGMWAKPDEMAEMLEQKVAHPKTGASCAWAPSPTAATLHATHYHDVNVSDVQSALLARDPITFSDLLTPPMSKTHNFSDDEIRSELENNAQGILGYVVRWINHGVGCSKVPDINGIGLMEDRATLRISSQHIANWLHHGVCTPEQVRGVLKRCAAMVDNQNADDKHYIPMGPTHEDSIAFQTAAALIFDGLDQPNGYTEPILHQSRIIFKNEYPN